MLAAAANATRTPTPNPLDAAELAQLHAPGPYKPGTAVSTAIAQKILSLKFVEMGDITDDDVHPGRSRPPISDILVWVEKFSTMAAVLVKRFPEKAPELLAYQACIVRCERNYRDGQWAFYDRAFPWHVINNRLYQDAFTGRARDIPRCSLCFEDPNPMAGFYMQWPGAPSQLQEALSPYRPPPPPQPQPRGNRGPSQELCKKFNKGLCRQTTCKYYTHACMPGLPGKPSGHLLLPTRHGPQQISSPTRPTPILTPAGAELNKPCRGRIEQAS